MTKYKYRINKQDDNTDWFELLPNNNNSQPVALSSCYNSFEEAKNGITRFRDYVATHIDRPFRTENIPANENKYFYRIYFNGNYEFLTKKFACKRHELKKAEEKIRKNYHAPFRADLSTE